jgi:uncharacterized membrane-anchored protein
MSTLDHNDARPNVARPWWPDQRAPWVRQVLTAAVVLQVAVLLAMTAMGSWPHASPGSRTVLLKVVPVDPRDLFRGDYVTLGYDLSRVPSTFEPGRTIYVTLAPDPDNVHWHGEGVSGEPPAGAPYLRGTVIRKGFAEFGIEKFFVPEGQGRPYEDAVRAHKLWAEVAVAPDGRAGLNRLVIE